MPADCLGHALIKSLSTKSLLLIALTAFILITPTFFFGQISGNDFNFHIESWIEVSHQWHQHVAWPSWDSGGYEGFGEPRFIFYPPLTWLIGGALGIVLPWRAVPDVFLVLILIFSGISMHRLASRWLPPDGALTAALIYITAPYSLVDVFVRSPTAEMFAGAILPLAILYAFNCADDTAAVADRGSRYRNVALLAICYAAIWLTNAPMSVVSSYALAFLLLFLAIQRRSLWPLLAGGAAMALGLLLACGYIVPATYEQRWVSIEQAISRGLIFADSIIFNWTAHPEHHLFNVMISLVASFEIVATFIAARILWRRFANAPAMRFGAVGIAVVSAAMMLPGTANVLQYLPKMRYIQFPWRWLIALGVCFAFFLGSAVASSRRRLLIGLMYGSLLAMFCMVLGTNFGWWDSEDIPETLAWVQSGQGYSGTEEYGPRVGDPNLLPDLPVNGPRVRLFPAGTTALTYVPDQPAIATNPSTPPDRWLKPFAPGTATVNLWFDQHKIFTVDSPTPVVAGLWLLNYPAWRVRVNGQPAAAETDPDTGEMLLPLGAGANRVEIYFGWTPDRTIGCALSALGVLILSCIAMIGWRRSPVPT